MNKVLVGVAMCLSLALAGCSSTSKVSGKSTAVPIEERSSGVGGEAGGGVPGAGVSTAGAPGASLASGGVGAGTGARGGDGAGAGAGTAGAAGAAAFQTQALGAAGAEGQSLGGSAGSVAGTGNPVTDPRFKDPNNILSKRIIYFDFDSYAIRDEFRAIVEAHARYLRENPSVRSILQGHTDERGSRDYNLALGQRRAESVKQAMSLMGVQDEQVEAVSLGEEKPAQEGHDEVAWQLNRRTEIYYQGE